MNRNQIVSVHVNIICHKHERRLIIVTRTKMEKGRKDVGGKGI